MKTLSISQLETISGEGAISSTITGACAGVGLAGWIGAVAISGGTAIAIGAVCAVNGLAGAYDWW